MIKKQGDRMGRRLAVLFPGIGYTTDRPLLHYARRIVTEAGYETVLLNYKKEIFGEGHVTKENVEQAFSQCCEILADYGTEQWEEILLIGKSVGTILIGQTAQWMKKTLGLKARIRFIALTPLAPAFPYLQGQEVFMASGTKDPMLKKEDAQKLAATYQLAVTYYEGANHSLEVKGDPEQSVQILADVVHRMIGFCKLPNGVKLLKK